MKRYIKPVCLAMAAAAALQLNCYAVTDYTGPDEDVTFSDVSTGAFAYEAILDMAQAGLMNGYEDGSFKPKGNISRAEFAAIVCRLMGAGAEAEQLSGSAFDDVPETHWASGYIMKAADMGIISGYGDGRFGPSDNVLYEQAVKMLVCAEGEGDNAEAQGGYPYGYIYVAEDMGILDGISYSISDAATRENIAVMLSNILKTRDNAFVSVENDELSITLD